MSLPVEPASPRRHWRRVAGRRAGEFWRRNRWYLLALAALLAIAIGFWGLTEASDDALPVSARLYKSLKLFSLGSDDVSGTVPWQLEVARFIAPLVVFTAIIGAVFAAMQRGSARARARRMKDHTIVVGLGDKGLTLAEQIDAAGRDVVIIERNEQAPNVGRARQIGIPVLVADATDRRTLVVARLDRADHLIAVAGTPDANAAISAAVLSFQRDVDPDARGSLRSFIEIRDVGVVRELQTAVDPERARYRQEFFNLDDRAAQALVGRFDSIWESPRQDEPPRPLIVIGLGQLGGGVIVELARRWDVVRLEGEGRHASVPLRIIALGCEPGADSSIVVDRLRARYPKIKTEDQASVGSTPACVVHALTLDPQNPRPAINAALASAGAIPGGVVLTVDDEALQVRAALAVRTALDGCPTRVVISAPHSEGLAGLVQSTVSATPELELFPIMESVCRDEEITQGRLAAMARSIHESYRRDLGQVRPADGPRAPGDVEWHELDPALRRQNVEAAQATWEALATVGYRVIPLHAEDAEQFCFSAEQVEYLAGREHARWFAAKFPERPVPNWDDVDRADQQKSRRQIEQIPRMLAFAGLQIDAERVPGEQDPSATVTSLW